MRVRWVAYKQRLPFGAPPKLGLVNFRFFTSSRLVFSSVLPSHVSLLTAKKHESSPHFRLLCREQKHPLPHMRTRSSNLQSSLVIFNYHKCLSLGIRRLLSDLFIQLFIQFQFSMSSSITLQSNLARFHTRSFEICIYVFTRSSFIQALIQRQLCRYRFNRHLSWSI